MTNETHEAPISNTDGPLGGVQYPDYVTFGYTEGDVLINRSFAVAALVREMERAESPEGAQAIRAMIGMLISSVKVQMPQKVEGNVIPFPGPGGKH